MATVFDSLFAQAGFPMLLSQFGESITYLPYGGGSRSITAIVDREPPAILDAAGNTVLPQFIVRVYNSATTGISSTELDKGKDELQFPKKVGAATDSTFSIGHLISQDAGVVQLAVI